MNPLIAVIVIVALFGCATEWTREEYAQVLRNYGPACERAGFAPNSTEWSRCAVYSAGGEPIPRSPQTLEENLMRLYGERCQVAGFKVGTGAFGQCLLAYADRDQAQRQALAAAFLLSQQPAKPPQITMPAYNQVNCTAIRAGIIVQISCR